jgi:hypothetical protein
MNQITNSKFGIIDELNIVVEEVIQLFASSSFKILQIYHRFSPYDV